MMDVAHDSSMVPLQSSQQKTGEYFCHRNLSPQGNSDQCDKLLKPLNSSLITTNTHLQMHELSDGMMESEAATLLGMTLKESIIVSASFIGCEPGEEASAT